MTGRLTTSLAAVATLTAGCVVLGVSMVARFVAAGSPIWLVLLAVSAGAVALALPHLSRATSPGGRLNNSLLILVAVCAALSGSSYFAQFMEPFTLPWTLAWSLYTALACATAAGLASPGARRYLAPVAFAGLHFSLAAATVLTSDPLIDVHVFLDHGAQALLDGSNPYSVDYPNIYGEEETRQYYGPGVVENSRVVFGAPYPPINLLWAVPAHLAGDVRLAGLVAVMALGIALWGRGTDRTANSLAVLLIASPVTAHVIGGSWTEASMAALLGLVVWSIRRGRMTLAAVLLGFLFSSKQYMVVALPCLWLLRPYATRVRLILAGGVAIGTVLPFALWNFSDFWRAIVEFQLIQPFRADSLSILVWWVNRFGWPGEAAFGVLPLAVGGAVALAAALSAKPGPATFAAGVGLSLLATVLFSKQAFVNYYFMVGVPFLVAAWHVYQPLRVSEINTGRGADETSPTPDLEVSTPTK